MVIGPIFLACILTALGEVAGASAELEARWRREYPLAAERWEAVAGNVLARGEFSFRYNNGITRFTKDLLVATAGDKRLFEFDERSTEPPGQPSRPDVSYVRCQTNEFVFELSKPPSTDPWMLGEYGRRDPEQDVFFQVDHYCDRFLRGATMYYGVSLLDRMNDPSFDLKSIEILQSDVAEVVRLRYSYEGENVSESGRVDLVPAMDWAIREVEVDIKNKKGYVPTRFEKACEYQEVGDGRLFPVRVEVRETTSNPEIYELMKSKLYDVKIGGVPDSLFSLTAYGLPQVPLSPAPRPSIFTFSNPFLWLALVGTVGSFSLLWVMRSRGRRPASS